eukprot:scaffold180_cov134-Isochrysis_galbana.AAC.6
MKQLWRLHGLRHVPGASMLFRRLERHRDTTKFSPEDGALPDARTWTLKHLALVIGAIHDLGVLRHGLHLFLRIAHVHLNGKRLGNTLNMWERSRCPRMLRPRELSFQ